MTEGEEGIRIGLVSVSDRASSGVYEDKGIPALRDWCLRAIATPVETVERLIPDDRFTIEKTLRELVDDERCDLVLTTGGTGPSRRDVTPEATLAVSTRELPGFGEQMRAISLRFVPTAILSRQVGALREIPDHAALIINLPGQPKAIAETLGGLRNAEGRVEVPGIFAAVPYCIDLIGGPYIETNPDVCKAFRPKSARRKPEAQAGNKGRDDKSVDKPASEPLAENAPREPEPARKPFVDPAPVRIPSGRPVEVEKDEEPLETFEIASVESSLPPPCTVIWLGSMAMDVHAFTELPSQVLSFGGPAARYVMVNAPMGELSADPGKPVRAWYDFPGNGLVDTEDLPGIRRSAKRISRLIDRISAKGMPRQRIFLAGFSQGAAMALYTGLHEDLSLAGIVALSGYLPLARSLPQEIGLGGRATPVFMGHGAFDDVVPLPYARQSAEIISRCGSEVFWREYNAEHDFGDDAVRDMARFMRNAVAKGA